MGKCSPGFPSSRLSARRAGARASGVRSEGPGTRTGCTARARPGFARRPGRSSRGSTTSARSGTGGSPSGRATRWPRGTFRGKRRPRSGPATACAWRAAAGADPCPRNLTNAGTWATSSTSPSIGSGSSSSTVGRAAPSGAEAASTSRRERRRPSSSPAASGAATGWPCSPPTARSTWSRSSASCRPASSRCPSTSGFPARPSSTCCGTRAPGSRSATRTRTTSPRGSTVWPSTRWAGFRPRATCPPCRPSLARPR